MKCLSLFTGQDTASKWGTCFKVLSRKVFCGLVLFPLQKLVITLWSFLYKKHKTQSVFTEMGQRDSLSKGPIFLCTFQVSKGFASIAVF